MISDSLRATRFISQWSYKWLISRPIVMLFVVTDTAVLLIGLVGLLKNVGPLKSNDCMFIRDPGP